MLKRVLVGLIVVVAVAATTWVAWRWQVQTVEIVVVNESAAAAELTWQRLPFAEPSVEAVPACASRSLRLPAGATWRFRADGLEVASAAFDIPPLARAVALEIWLETDGSSRLVLPYSIGGSGERPLPTACPSAPD